MNVSSSSPEKQRSKFLKRLTELRSPDSFMAVKKVRGNVDTIIEDRYNNIEHFLGYVKFRPNIQVLLLTNLRSIPEGMEFPEGLQELYLRIDVQIPKDFKFPPGLKIEYI